MSESAYAPFVPARRPGKRPAYKPRYRVLVHRRFRDLWDSLVERVGLQNAQQFYDHVAQRPGSPPDVGASVIFRGEKGRPIGPGFSNTVHYEITGAGRINYQFNDYYQGPKGDLHPVVVILTIDLGSH